MIRIHFLNKKYERHGSSLHSLFRFLTEERADPELETFRFQNFPEGKLPSWLYSGSCMLPEDDQDF